MAYFGIFDATSRDYENKRFGDEILPEDKDTINTVIADVKSRFQTELTKLLEEYSGILLNCRTPEAIYKQIRDWSQAEGAGGCLTFDQQYLMRYMLQLQNVRSYFQDDERTTTERLLDSLIYVHCVDALFTSSSDDWRTYMLQR